MQNAIHFRRSFARMVAPPGVGKAKGIGAAAFKTGAVSGSERCHFIEKKQFCIAITHDRAFSVFEAQHATNPLARGPSFGGMQEAGLPVVDFTAPIAIEQSALLCGDDGSVGADPVLKGPRHWLIQ
jgi:hypothetical protein